MKAGTVNQVKLKEFRERVYFLTDLLRKKWISEKKFSEDVAAASIEFLDVERNYNDYLDNIGQRN